METKTADKKCAELDEESLFNAIGNFGPWQRNVFVTLFVVNIMFAWQNLSLTFLAPNHHFWCTSAPHVNMSNAFVSSIAIASRYTEDQCGMTAANSTDGILPCTKWEFDVSVYSHTIVSEWSLVCGREWLISFAKSIYMIGFMVSSLVTGQLSDNFGRFSTIMASWFIMCISSILSAFSPSYIIFIVLRFVVAFSGVGFLYTGYVLMMEITGPKWRTLVGMVFQLGFVIGLVTLPAIAWFVRHWKYLQLVLSTPIMGLICIYWILPESPRWLMTRGNRKKFEMVIIKAAAKNGCPLKDDIKNISPFPDVESDEEKAETITIRDLVRTPQIRKEIINGSILWAVTAFVYYGLSYNTNDLGGDPYFNAFLCGVVEFPSFGIGFLAIRKVGRRSSVFASMMIGGFACAVIFFLPSDLNWPIVTSAMIGKLCISGTFGILHLYTAEMFPTSIRNLAYGACSMCGGIGSIASSFERELGKAIADWVPNVLNGALALCAAPLVLFLPETKDKKIPDTIDEGEKMGQ